MFWDPFDEIGRLHEEMDRIFGRTLKGSGLLEHKGKRDQVAPYRPAVSDIYETENSVIATFELPGANKEDIELNVTDDRVEVKVERKMEKEHKGKDSYAYAKSSQCFYRALPLPADVKAEEAEASYKNGVLRIEIPKAKKEHEKKRKIEIK